jgi:hypothetical protein
MRTLREMVAGLDIVTMIGPAHKNMSNDLPRLAIMVGSLFWRSGISDIDQSSLGNASQSKMSSTITNPGGTFHGWFIVIFSQFPINY